MRNLAQQLLILAVASLALSGCGIGYDKLLFITKSNVGIDFDAQPPTASIDISRKEGVIEPTFEDGKTLPVMASFRPSSRGIIAGNVKQTFAVGDAALVMAFLYDSDDSDFHYNDSENSWSIDLEDAFDSSLELTSPPTLPKNQPFPSSTEVKPVFFGTTTSLGLASSWSNVTSAWPNSFHFGYRRKELALSPVNYRSNQNSNNGMITKVSTPSLLATIDTTTEGSTPTDSKLVWFQYFATGKAATSLALRKDVRTAMLKRLDPEQLTVRLEGAGRNKIAVLRLVFKELNEAAKTGDAIAAVYKKKLDELDKLIPAKYPVSIYKWTVGSLQLEKKAGKNKGDPVTHEGFHSVLDYSWELKSSLQDLKTSIAKPEGNLKKDDGSEVLINEQETIRFLTELLVEVVKYHTEYQKELSGQQSIDQAISYYFSRPEG